LVIVIIICVVYCFLFFFFLHCYRDLLDLHSFPTRRSSDLPKLVRLARLPGVMYHRGSFQLSEVRRQNEDSNRQRSRRFRREGTPDRKSTRLNSSHLGISYAVFCLKKKKKTDT